MDAMNTMTPAMRGAPGAHLNPPFVPNPYFNPGMNMNIAHQQYAHSPPMGFYPPNFNPTTYSQANATRPGATLPKYQNMDPKFAPPQNQIVHPNAPPQHPSNMTRRPSSNYFQVPPPMSPVQNSYAPRGWIPNNTTLLPSPMSMQNGTGGMQNAPMYQPAMLPGNGNPALITPPGGVASNFTPAYAPTAVPNHGFGYPTPPEPQALVGSDIPPAIPSVYPDPAYSNINNCIYNPKGTTNVYIRGLRPETTDDDLLHMVQQYGNIISTKAIIDTQTKSCKGSVL